MKQSSQPNRIQHEQEESEANIQKLPIDHLVFYEQYQPNDVVPYEDQRKAFQLYDGRIKISNVYLWQAYCFDLIISKIKQIKEVKLLSFQKLGVPFILCSIQHISLPTLISIHLTHNNIESIQALRDLMVPNLKRLCVGHNHISNIQAIRKMHIPNVRTVDISNNPVPNGKDLTQLCEKNLENIMIENSDQQKYHMADITWYFKLESLCPRLGVLHSKRKSITSLMRKLKEKIVNNL